MSRLPDSPMTPDEFDDALGWAQAGRIVTDMGASDELDAALYAISESSHPIPPALLTAAQDAYRRQVA